MISAPSLADVARRAGVSPATVSRHFNQPGLVNPQTRSRIDAAVKELGYVPNGAARALASKRSRMIGVIVPTLDHAIFADAINSIEQRLGQDGYTLIVASNRFDPDQEHVQVQTLLSHRVDALVLVGVDRDPATYRLLQSKGVPYVTIWVVDPQSRHPGVGIDNTAAAHRVTSYLLDLGHRSFGVISACTDYNDRARQRLRGVEIALEERGLALPPDSIIERPIDLMEGQLGLKYLMEQRPRPSAIVCSSDVLAAGAILGSRKLGIKIPDDVSITGFDDMELASQIDPPLTTVSLPIPAMSLRAAEYLLARLNGHPVSSSTILDTELVLRESTAPPRQP